MVGVLEMSKITTFQQLGQLGGQAKYRKHGKEGMAAMARIGVEKNKQRDPDYYKKLSQKGLEARRRNYEKKNKSGYDHFIDSLTGKHEN